MTEEYFIRLFIKQQSLKKSIEDLKEQLKDTKKEIDHINLDYWWKPADMCHNYKECGDHCKDCDMPEEMWENTKKILKL